MKKIAVIGSSNTDMVIKSDRIPVPGETVLGGNFFMNPGGKGANQAVAAARMDGNVTFIAKVGNDLFGKESIANWQKENIDTKHVIIDESNPSGVALIMVDSKGENCISVALGANASLSPKDLQSAKNIIENSDIVLMQLETPLDTITTAAKWAYNKGVKVILNPAPAAKLPFELLQYLYLITPNETEAELLTNIKVTDQVSAKKAADILHLMGVKNVIITMGKQGAYLSCSSFNEIIPAYKVTAIDTVAAGDVFNGALAVALSENLDWITAVKLAQKAASISVTRIGAQSSAPRRAEITLD